MRCVILGMLFLLGCGDVSDMDVTVYPSGEEPKLEIKAAFPESVTPTVYVLRDACPADVLDSGTDFWTNLGYPVVWEYVDNLPEPTRGVLTFERVERIDHIKENVIGVSTSDWRVYDTCMDMRGAHIQVEVCKPYVIAHEIGHSIGLGHSYNPKSLMYYKNSPLSLPQDEIEAILDARYTLACQGDSHAKVSSQRPRNTERNSFEQGSSWKCVHD